VLIIVFHYLRPFVWFAFSSAPYVPGDAPLDPDSNEWLVIQAIRFCSGLIAGCAAARWSPPNSRAIPAIYFGLTLISLFFLPPPATQSFLRRAVWSIGSVLGVIVGSELYRYRERKRSVGIAPKVSAHAG
jgi:hypothetical protein